MIKPVVVCGIAAIQLLCGAAFSARIKQRQTQHDAVASDAPVGRLSLKMGEERMAESALLKEVMSSATFSDPLSVREVNTSKLRHYQDKAAPIATSFEPSPYRPMPFLSNCHLQTIGGVFLRDLEDCAYVTDVALTVTTIVGRALNGKKENEADDDEWFWDERQRIDTPDNDFFHVDYKYGSNEEGIVVLLHGLQSNSNSSLSIDLANAYHHQLGMTVACINFRGCSGVPNDTVGGYHLGFTDDLKQFLSHLKRNGHSRDDKPVYISGVSLGGNVVLKALGELGADALTKYHVHGAAVAGVPFDHERNCRVQNSNAFTREVYINNFVRSLQDRTQQQLEIHCNGDEDTDAFDYPRAMAAGTNYEWEDAVIAPIYGFDDYVDYYRRTSCIRFIDYIAVPTLIVNARDDPLFDPLVFPVEKSVEGGGKSPLKMVRTEHGGHLGYIFHQTEQTDEKRVASWMPTELAAFVEHVHDHPQNAYRKSQ